jgi:hypothetical protein
VGAAVPKLCVSLSLSLSLSLSVGLSLSVSICASRIRRCMFSRDFCSESSWCWRNEIASRLSCNSFSTDMRRRRRRRRIRNHGRWDAYATQYRLTNAAAADMICPALGFSLLKFLFYFFF